MNEKVDFDGFFIEVKPEENGDLVVLTHVLNPPHPNYKTPPVRVERGGTHIISQGEKRQVISNPVRN